MNAFALMIKDHRKVASLEKLIDTTNEDNFLREEIFRNLKLELESHELMEETVFYPKIKNEKGTHEVVLEAFEEHHVVKILLDELEATPKNHDEWLAKLTVLKENVEHHVKEEENEMFRGAEELLTEKEADELGKKMEEIKNEYMQKHDHRKIEQNE